MSELNFKVNDVEYQLPTWYAERSDEEIEKAKRVLIEEYSREVEPLIEEFMPIQFDEKEICRQLKEAGFEKNEIEEIIADMYCGRTLDSVMQKFD